MLLQVPRMFQDDYLESLLTREEYEFVLDRACIQFEPYSPAYQRVTSITYQHINDHNNFDSLRSTRHFGPFVFFLAWFKSMDGLLLNLIETSHIEELNSLLKVMLITRMILTKNKTHLMENRLAYRL